MPRFVLEYMKFQGNILRELSVLEAVFEMIRQLPSSNDPRASFPMSIQGLLRISFLDGGSNIKPKFLHEYLRDLQHEHKSIHSIIRK